MNILTIMVVAILALLATIFACMWLAEPKRALRQFSRFMRWIMSWPLAFKYRALDAWANVNFSGADKTHEIAINRIPDASITSRYLLYKKGAGTNTAGVVNSSIAVIAAQTDVPLGSVADEWSVTASPGQPVALELLGCRQSTMRLRANAAGLAVGDLVYGVAGGFVDKKANLTGSSTAYCVGVIVDIPNQVTTAAQGDVVEVATDSPALTTT